MSATANTDEIAARVIRLHGSSNLRDLGGYRSEDGRSLRWRTIFRSGALSQLNELDWRWLSNQRLTTVCDLRCGHERELAPTIWPNQPKFRQIEATYDARTIFGPTHKSVDGAGALTDMHRSLYEYFADLLFPWIKEIFAALLNEHAPILIHCSAGQDRTGVAAGLILIVLGVPMTTVIEDYLLSTECRTFENELNRAGLEQFAEHNPVARFYTDVLRERGEGTLLPKRLVGSNGEPLLRLAFDAVERRWGSLNDYLLALGVGAPEMARLRELYLE